MITLAQAATTVTQTVTETLTVTQTPSPVFVPVQQPAVEQGTNWSLWISIFALLVAGLSLLWNIISWRNSGARLKVRLSAGFISDRNDSVDAVGVIIENAGRLTTTINVLKFPYRQAGIKKFIHFDSSSFMYGCELPQSLAPGERVTYLLKDEVLIETLKRCNVNARQLSLVVSTGHADFNVQIPEKVLAYIDGLR
ncbi:hypothetical protein CKALI_03755 [Corynebacterium kalinowskii]|uniref:Uncharacterized protein n=1 Tax=Corynebacterium kalinowskii TaxID=2675216 RepID=A0A6B8V962_9CORY|nr:hypothetical protein [Corynebacterium kalinowskii]QGU01632.1 hypothetical protein CKALI_03755 [Corynebacterium kalinowskii]